MTTAGEVLIHVGDSGTTVQLSRVLASLENQMRQTDAAGSRLGQTTGSTLASGQQRAASSALALAQADARLLRDQGDLVAAAQRLRTALAGVDQSTVQAINARRQLLAVDKQLETGQSSLARAFNEAGASAKSSLLGMVGPAALVTTGIGAAVAAAKSFQDAFNFKTTLDASTAAINDQLRGVRDIGQVWAEAGAFAKKYSLTQQETNDILRSSIDTMRASSSSVTELETALLRLQSRDVSKPISEAARAMRELQAGDVTSIKELFNVPAAEALKMKTAIAGGADGVKVLSDFLDRAGNGMEVLERRTQGAVGKMNELKKAQEDLVLAQAEFAQGPGMAILEGRINATRGATRLLSGDFDAMAQSITAAGNQGSVAFSALDTALAGSLSNIAGVQNAANELAAANQQAATATDLFGGSIGAEIAIAQAAAPTHALFAASIQQVTAAMSEDAVMLQQVGAQTEGATFAAQQHANALAVQTQRSLEASLQSQELAGFQRTLALLGGQVAGGLITAANAAAILEAQYGKLSGEAIRLINLQAQLARVTGVAASVGGSVADAAANAAAAELEAQNRQILAVGTHTQKLGLLRAEYDRMVKQYGATSAQAIDAQTRVLQEEDKTAKARKAGGAARLSDQQKLNNTLLTDQQRADDQAEALEKKHQQKLLDIDKEFQKKSLEQLKANELSKRETEIDFLKQLTSSELNNSREGKAELARIDAQYYADFAKAQEAAQAGNLKQSEELAAQARHRADVEIQYAEKIEAAKKAKNQDEVTRLTALREKERQLLAEQDKQIQEGGDPIVKARDEALADEQRSFEEQQGKIGDAADAAAQRKIDAALRSGKAIDAENLRLQEQEQIINRIGARATPAPGTPAGTGTAPSAPAEGGGTAAAPADLSGLADALRAAADQITQAIGDSSNAIVRAEQATTSAVRQSNGTRLMQ